MKGVLFLCVVTRNTAPISSVHHPAFAKALSFSSKNSSSASLMFFLRHRVSMRNHHFQQRRSDQCSYNYHNHDSRKSCVIDNLQKPSGAGKNKSNFTPRNHPNPDGQFMNAVLQHSKSTNLLPYYCRKCKPPPRLQELEAVRKFPDEPECPSTRKKSVQGKPKQA
jgi:hypothetical protein